MNDSYRNLHCEGLPIERKLEPSDRAGNDERESIADYDTQEISDTEETPC